MSTPLHDLGLVFVGSSTDIRPEGLTAHYWGDSPWGSGADRSSPERFAATTDHRRCASIIRAGHDYHLSKGWFGFAYTSATCPHGHRFEGRGPGRRTGAQGTEAGNDRSYATVYLAGAGDPLTDAGKVAFHEEAVRLGVPLRWDHSDWKPTSCAGDSIRAWEAAGWPYPGSAPDPEEDDMVAPLLAQFREKADDDSAYHTYRRSESGAWVWLGSQAEIDQALTEGVPWVLDIPWVRINPRDWQKLHVHNGPCANASRGAPKAVARAVLELDDDDLSAIAVRVADEQARRLSNR